MVGRVSAKPFSDSAKHSMFLTKHTLTERKSPLESSVSKLFWKKASVAYSLISCSLSSVGLRLPSGRNNTSLSSFSQTGALLTTCSFVAGVEGGRSGLCAFLEYRSVTLD